MVSSMRSSQETMRSLVAIVSPVKSFRKKYFARKRSTSIRPMLRRKKYAKTIRDMKMDQCARYTMTMPAMMMQQLNCSTSTTSRI